MTPLELFEEIKKLSENHNKNMNDLVEQYYIDNPNSERYTTDPVEMVSHIRMDEAGVTTTLYDGLLGSAYKMAPDGITIMGNVDTCRIEYDMYGKWEVTTLEEIRAAYAQCETF